MDANLQRLRTMRRMNSIVSAEPTPALCLLIPVFDNITGLQLSLSSLKRDGGTFDVLVVDDGSVEPVRAESLTAPGRRVVVIRLPQNQGVRAALNVGLQWIAERGYPYVGRLDAGDEIESDRFQKQLSVLMSNRECVLAASNVLFIDVSGDALWLHRTPAVHGEIRRGLLYGNCIIHPSVTMRMSAVMEAGGYSAAGAAIEDYDLFRRLSHVGTLASIPETLTKCRHYRQGISVRLLRRQRVERLALQLRWFEPGNIHAYLGLARSILAMMAPGRANEWRKMLRARS